MTLAIRSRPDAGAVELALCGEPVVLDWRGVAYFPRVRLLAVADLHLEKAAAYARRGSMLPPYDSIATLTRLADAIAAYAPCAVACLGDSFHEPDSHRLLHADLRARLEGLAAGRDWYWIRGNHDPEPPAGLAGFSSAELRLGDLNLHHEPGMQAGEVAGHLHPGARVRIRGRSLRRRCFAFDGARLILPAFGALTGSLNLRSPAFDGLFDPARLCAYLLGEGALHGIPGACLLPG